MVIELYMVSVSLEFGYHFKSVFVSKVYSVTSPDLGSQSSLSYENFK